MRRNVETAHDQPCIYWLHRSTYTWAIRMVCEEKAIDYELRETTLRSPYLAIYPFGKMPVLRHGDVELFELKAIATYLDRSFPGPSVFPSDTRRAALAEQWVSLVNTVIDHTLIRTYSTLTPRLGRPTEAPTAMKSTSYASRQSSSRCRQGRRDDRPSCR